MTDTRALDAAIETTLRAAVASLRGQTDELVALAAGLVEDPTGFFVAGLPRSTALAMADREELWFPSEWPLEGRDPSDVAPGRVTTAIWALAEDLEDDDTALGALRRTYEERIIAALAALRADGTLDDAWAWLHYADAHDEDLDDRSFPLLNDPALVPAFARRWDDRDAAALLTR